MSEAHNELVARGKRWLRNQGCRVILADPFRANVPSGEQPDVIGWRDGLSILLEAKVSRSDFMADRSKKFRVSPELGMGDWRYFLCPPDVIKPDDLPQGWSLLWAHERKIEVVHGGPRGNVWWADKPFEGHKRSETCLLVSAMARGIA